MVDVVEGGVVDVVEVVEDGVVVEVVEVVEDGVVVEVVVLVPPEPTSITSGLEEDGE